MMMAQEKFPEGALVEVRMEVRVPIAATADEIEAWIEFELHANGSVSGNNPLLGFEARPFANSFELNFTDLIGREERFNERETEGGGKTYSVRYIRETAPA